MWRVCCFAATLLRSQCIHMFKEVCRSVLAPLFFRRSHLVFVGTQLYILEFSYIFHGYHIIWYPIMPYITFISYMKFSRVERKRRVRGTAPPHLTTTGWPRHSRDVLPCRSTSDPQLRSVVEAPLDMADARGSEAVHGWSHRPVLRSGPRQGSQHVTFVGDTKLAASSQPRPWAMWMKLATVTLEVSCFALGWCVGSRMSQKPKLVLVVSMILASTSHMIDLFFVGIEATDISWVLWLSRFQGKLDLNTFEVCFKLLPLGRFSGFASSCKIHGSSESWVMSAFMFCMNILYYIAQNWYRYIFSVYLSFIFFDKLPGKLARNGWVMGRSVCLGTYLYWLKPEDRKKLEVCGADKGLVQEPAKNGAMVTAEEVHFVPSIRSSKHLIKHCFFDATFDAFDVLDKICNLRLNFLWQQTCPMIYRHQKTHFFLSS